MSDKLTVLTDVERRLSAIRTVDEAKSIRDQAEALRVYAKSARKGLAIQNHAAFVKIQAERRAGELLAKIERSNGGRGKTGSSLSQVYEESDIAPATGKMWQTMASVPDERVRELAAEATDGGEEFTSAAIYRLAREERTRVNDAKKLGPVETPPLPQTKYRCIVIDPPWPMQKIDRDERPNQGKQLDYPTMSLEAIGELDVGSLADDAGCHLYLWVTQKYLPAGLALLEQWGFQYQCVMTWVKNVGFTPFSWMYSTEHVLFARRGSLALERLGLRLDFGAAVTRHSEKPDVFYRRVIEASPAPRLEMFQRTAREGFDAWGAEAPRIAGEVM